MRKYITGILVLIVISFVFLWISSQRKAPKLAGHLSGEVGNRVGGQSGDQRAATSPTRNPASTEPSYLEFNPARLEEYLRGAPFLIHGRIRDEEQAPVSDATVTLFSSRSPFPSFEFTEPIMTSRSRQDGSYELHLDLPVSGWVVVEKAGFAAAEAHVGLEQAGAITKNFILVPAVAAMSGTVTDEAGKPIAGAAAYVSFPQIGFADRMPSPRVAITDDQGQFELVGLPEQQASVAVSAQGLWNTEGRIVNLSREERTHLTFTLKRGRSLTLVIKDDKGEPIVFPWAKCSGIFAASGDKEGSIIITVPEGSTFECEVFAKGYLSRKVEVDPSIPFQTVALEPGLLVAGRVSSTRGYPIKDAEISILDDSSGRERLAGVATSDESGRFATRISSRHISRLSVRKEGFVEKKITVETDQASQLDVVLEPGSAGIYGRVVDQDGAPIEEFMIILRVKGDPEGQSFSYSFVGDLGRFTILDLPAETFSLIAIHLPSGSRRTLAEIKTLPGTLYGELIIRLHRKER